MFRVKHATGAGAVSVVLPTASDALNKAREFQDEERTGVEVRNWDGDLLSLEELDRLVRQSEKSGAASRQR